MDVLAEGVEAIAEALGSILLTGAIDEHRAQRFVEALASARGLEEEQLTRCVVHNGIPGCESFRS